MEDLPRLDRVSEDTIRNTLYRVRAQIVRDELEGLEHVDALLRLRGFDPEAFHIPKKRPKVFRRGVLRPLILSALRERPMTVWELTDLTAPKGPGLSPAECYRRVYLSLAAAKRIGLVDKRRDETGRYVWGLPH